MAWKHPTNQPIDYVEVPESEDDGEEPGNNVHTPFRHPRCSQPPPQEKLKLSQDEESEDDESQEEESEEESKEEEEEDEEETDETEGESGEEEEQSSPVRGPTQSKGKGVNETNLTIMTNSAARNEEMDDLDKGKLETELRTEYLGIFLEFTELHKRMAILKRKARHHNIKINDEDDDGCLLPSKKRCDWCNILKQLP